MMKKNIDHRVVVTEKWIKKAFIDLLMVKPIYCIKVKEVCENAGINRGTFYLHYKDIYDLLDKLKSELLEGFNQTLMEQIKHNEITLSTIEHIFHYFKENRDFCIVILVEHGNTKILTEFLEIGKKKYKETYSQEYNEFMDYQYQFISAGCLGVLKQWLFDENQISEEEIAKIVYRLINGK